MIKIKEAIVVEGRYDKNTVSQIVDTCIIETSGFGIFSDSEKIALLRRIAEKRGLIILTDSDGAGFVIRNYLKGSLGTENIRHAYIPGIAGKEKRKKRASKEGIIGVEGMKPETIIEALKRAGATFEGDNYTHNDKWITVSDMYRFGLTGGKNSAKKRKALKDSLNLPDKLSLSALLDVMNLTFSKEEGEEFISQFNFCYDTDLQQHN